MPRKKSSPSPAQKQPNDARRKKAGTLLRELKKLYPVVECALVHRNAYELTVATILSAQCTDERVNKVTPHLFAEFPSPVELSQAMQKDVEQIIHSLGFFRAKATNLIGMAQGVVERHDGEIPCDHHALCQLPGIGRKTANVVMGVWFREASGIVVDTHVKRLSRLMGLTVEKTPEKIETDLATILPEKEWIDFSHRLIEHGRRICIARRPQCLSCTLLPTCDRVGLPPLEEPS